jgi:hypothetical protein
MKKKITLALVAIIAVVAMSFDILSSNGKAGYTNSPGENNCTYSTSCHNTYAVNTGSGSVAITAAPSLATGYIPGTVYTMTVTVANSVAPNNVLFGVDCEALLASGANGGTLAITDAVLTQMKTSSGTGPTRNNVVHKPGSNVGPNSQAFSFHWTAPATGSGVVTFYASGVASSGDGSAPANDYTYTTSKAVSENTSGIAENMVSNFNFSIFPNPSSDNLNVKLTLNETSSVTMNLIDITGKKIANFISDNGINGDINRTFDISSYSKGIYFIELKINDKVSLQKIVIE